MSDIQTKLSSIQSRINSANQDEARNDILRERAEAEYKESMDLLKEEFGVSNLDEARELLNQMESDLQNIASQVESALDEMGV